MMKYVHILTVVLSAWSLSRSLYSAIFSALMLDNAASLPNRFVVPQYCSKLDLVSDEISVPFFISVAMPFSILFICFSLTRRIR
jgi:hypothetical protein